jgi:hypothetical protein
MIPAMNRRINKQAGMTNLFLRYQLVLENLNKIFMKNILLRKSLLKLTQFLDKEVHLSIEIE